MGENKPNIRGIEMNNITIKGLIDEDFVNYKVPSMTIMFPRCNFKCEENGSNYCQNSNLVKKDNIIISIDDLCKRYLQNPITESIVCQGLEPFDSFSDLFSLIKTLRMIYNCNDDIVIYTGYNKDEIEERISAISQYQNIIVKFGRFIPFQNSHYDEVLKVMLASDNQYGERIS